MQRRSGYNEPKCMGTVYVTKYAKQNFILNSHSMNSIEVCVEHEARGINIKY